MALCWQHLGLLWFIALLSAPKTYIDYEKMRKHAQEGLEWKGKRGIFIRSIL